MIKKIAFLIVLLFSIQVVFSTSVSCQFRENICQSGETPIFYANDNFFQENPLNPLKPLSSPMELPGFPRSNFYSKPLCCSSPHGSLNFEFKSNSQSCSDGSEEIMFFTNYTNGRVSFAPSTDTYYRTCVTSPENFSSFDIKVNDSLIYQRAGYSCIYRVSNFTNAHISSCDAKFDNGKTYKYAVWARLFENTNSLRCNSDCTSKLDSRVYSACSSKVRGCELVPTACDGSIYGGWVKVPNSSYEVQCSAPWDNYRAEIFTNEAVNVEGASNEEDSCQNIISKKYNVFIDNEQVVMKIYVCED